MTLKTKLFSYNLVDTFVHRLSGLTKLICFLFLTFAVMYSYDIRVVLLVMLFSIGVLALARVRFAQVRTMVIYVLIFVITNAIITFFFAPESNAYYGTGKRLGDAFSMGKAVQKKGM